MTYPVLSIIIPVYNSEKYLVKCIESILSQNINIYELLLIDNGSTDSSKDICDYYSNIYDCIKTYHIPNKGVSNARNYGIEHSSGKWIVFIDSDDFVSPEYLETIKGFLNLEVDLIIFNYIRYISEQKEEQGLLTIKEGLHKTSVELFNLAVRLEVASLSVWSSVYKMDVVNKYNLRFREDMKTCEDFMFSLSYYNYIERFYVIDKALYYYRQNPNSTTSTRNLSHAYNYQLVFDTISDIIKYKRITIDNISLFEERWTKWIIDLVYNYKLQNINNVTIKESVYNQPYYKKILYFKSNNFKFKVERFLLKYQMNLLILIYCRFIAYIKKVTKHYKI